MRSSTRIVMLACTAAMVFGTVVFVAVSLFALPSAPSGAPRRDVDVAAERAVRDLNQMGISLPAGTRFLAGKDQSVRDTEVWALIELPPEHVPRLRDDIRKFAARARSPWVLDETPPAVDAPRRLGFHPPSWWRPDQFPDPAPLSVAIPHGAGCVFVFSETRSQMYVLIYSV